MTLLATLSRFGGACAVAWPIAVVAFPVVTHTLLQENNKNTEYCAHLVKLLIPVVTLHSVQSK